MIQCRLIDAHGTTLWFGMDERKLPHEIRRPTGRMVDMKPEESYFLASVGVKAEQVEEVRLFRLYYADWQSGVADYREVAA